MPLLNYTTEVPISKTASEIVGMLAKAGAMRISQSFGEDGAVAGIDFMLKIGSVPVLFQLPVQVDSAVAVYRKIKPHRTGRYADWEKRTRAQGERVAWRIVKDWVEVQLAMVELQQAEIGQLFMPYAVDGNGLTVWDRWIASQQKQLVSEVPA